MTVIFFSDTGILTMLYFWQEISPRIKKKQNKRKHPEITITRVDSMDQSSLEFLYPLPSYLVMNQHQTTTSTVVDGELRNGSNTEHIMAKRSSDNELSLNIDGDWTLAYQEKTNLATNEILYQNVTWFQCMPSLL